MLLLLAQATIDAAKVITEADLKDPGFQQWLAYAVMAFILWEKISKFFTKGTPEKREISGTLDTKPAATPADKSEVEQELASLENSIENLSEKFDTKVHEILAAGQLRAEKIINLINSEVSAIRAETQKKITDIHDRIASAVAKDAGHDEAISTLKVTQNVHGNQIAQIQQRLPRPRIP